MGLLLVHPSPETTQIRKRLFQAPLHLLSLVRRHHVRSFSPLPLRASRQLSHKLEVLEQDLGGADLHRRLFDLAPCTKEELGTLQDTPAYVPGSISPGLVQIADLAAREVVLRDGFGQGLAVLSTRPCHGHQVLHRRLGRDASSTDVLLHRPRKIVDQGKPLGNPAHASVKPLRHLLVAQREIA
jgi:hypothetical protein